MKKKSRVDEDESSVGKRAPRFARSAVARTTGTPAPDAPAVVSQVFGTLPPETFPLIDAGKESFFRFLAENSGDVLWMYDFRVDRYVYVSPSVIELRGFTPEECCRQTLYDALTPASALVAEEEIQTRLSALQRGDMSARSAVREFDQLCRDGSVVPTEVTTTFLQDGDGNLSGIIGIARDIRERRRIEAEKEQMQSLLLKAGKIESMSRIAGGIAHDFNNHLQSILGNADLMLSRVERDSEYVEGLEEIRNAVAHCAALTKSLLSFARRRVAAPRVIACDEAVASLVHALRPTLPSPVRLTFTADDGLWPVKMDAAQFEEIVSNLVDNALEAIDGKGRIDISARNIAMGGDGAACDADALADDMVLVEVSDTGRGMAPEVLEHIFDPFFTTRNGASGLGLSSVYGIVEQAGGFVSVDSIDGRGTVMKLFLPRCKAFGEGPTGGAAMASSGGTLALEGTILLVDDEDAVRHITRRFLESIGFNVLDAENGDAALARAREHEGDITMLLTDMVMPGMDGRELAEKLAGVRRGLKTLFMSGYAPDAFADGEDEVHFLGKPFSRDALTSKIREVLGS